MVCELNQSSKKNTKKKKQIIIKRRVVKIKRRIKFDFHISDFFNYIIIVKNNSNALIN